jgi:hypothetical protein
MRARELPGLERLQRPDNDHVVTKKFAQQTRGGETMKVLNTLLVLLFVLLPSTASAAGALQTTVFGQAVPCDGQNYVGQLTNTTGGSMFVRGANFANLFPAYFGYTTLERFSTGEVILFVLNDGTSTIMLPSGSYVLIGNGEKIAFASQCLGGIGGLSIVTVYYDTTLP